jgi:tetratricopeptide (TPR) repeat protein
VAFRRGEALLDAKKYKEAAAAFDEAQKHRPGDAAAISGKKAAEAGAKPPAVNPKKVAYDRAMAEATSALKAGKNEDAKKAYERALAAMPDMKEAEAGLADVQKRLNAEGYVAAMRRGQALMSEKKFKEAEATYDQALKYKPGDAAAIAGKKAAQAAQKPAEPPKKTSDPPKKAGDPLAEFNRQISLGQTLEKSGKVAQALVAYQNALKAVADDTAHKAEQARAYAGIGRCEHVRKNFDEAVTAYEEVLKRTPGDAAVKAALARAKKKM